MPYKMKIGTKSVLFGAHCFFLHPWDALPKFPKMPGYYRAHPSTIINMGRYIDPLVDGRDVERLGFSGIKIVPDSEVTPGEFWPPEGWEEKV